MPASYPGSNFVQVACAPIVASPQIAAIATPGFPGLKSAFAAEAKTTFPSAFCPWTRPTDHATTIPAASATTNNDRPNNDRPNNDRPNNGRLIYISPLSSAIQPQSARILCREAKAAPWRKSREAEP